MTGIPYERFADNVLAHIEYVRERPFGEAFDGLQRRLDDESWRHQPARRPTWTATLSPLSWPGPSPLSRADAVDAVIRRCMRTWVTP